MERSPDYKFKILILGSGNVGKTSLVRRFVERHFYEDYLPTLGVNLLGTDVSIDFQGKLTPVALSIWDVAGQDVFRRLVPTYHLGANGVLYVVDLTRPQTIDTLKQWHADVRQNVPKPLPTLLLGNKCDLEHSVDENAITAAMQLVGAFKFLKTSAKTGENVPEAFMILTKAILEKNPG